MIGKLALRAVKSARNGVFEQSIFRGFSLNVKEVETIRSKISENTKLIVSKSIVPKPKHYIMEQTLLLLSKLEKTSEANSDSELEAIVEMLESDKKSLISIKDEVLASFLVKHALNSDKPSMKAILHRGISTIQSGKGQSLLFTALLNDFENLTKGTIDERSIIRLVEYAVDKVNDKDRVYEIVSLAIDMMPRSNEYVRKALRRITDQKMLAKFWSKDLAVEILLQGCLTYQNFIFLAVHEFGSLENFLGHLNTNLGKSPEQIAQILSMNNLEFLRQTRMEGQPKLIFDDLDEPEEYCLDLVNSRKYLRGSYEKAKREELPLNDTTSQVKMLFINNQIIDYEWTLPELLNFIHISKELKIADADDYWEDNKKWVVGKFGGLRLDFESLLKSNHVFFSSKHLVENYYNEYMAIYKDIIKDLTTPKHFDDTKTALWERILPELMVLADGLVKISELEEAAPENYLLHANRIGLSKLVCNALIEPILHPEFEKDFDNYLTFTLPASQEKEESLKVNKSQAIDKKKSKRENEVVAFQSSVEKLKHIQSTDLAKGYESWKDLEPLVKIDKETIAKWTSSQMSMFMKLALYAFGSNLGDQKFLLGCQRVIEEVFNMLPIQSYGSVLKGLAEMNYVTEDLKSLIEDKIILKLDGILKEAKSTMNQADFTAYCINIAYFAALFQNYNQIAWNALFSNIDPAFIEQNLDKVNSQDLILLSQIILLTRMEAPYVKSAKFDYMMEYFAGLNQTEFDLFKKSEFSQQVARVLKRFYYDDLEAYQLAELFKVHFVQGTHALLCLSNPHFVIGSRLVRGRVELSIRLLKHLNFEVHIISKRDYPLKEKRTARLNYLQKCLVGVSINEKRKHDTENASIFD